VISSTSCHFYFYGKKCMKPKIAQEYHAKH